MLLYDQFQVQWDDKTKTDGIDKLLQPFRFFLLLAEFIFLFWSMKSVDEMVLFYYRILYFE